jgi:hypothetical protein
VAFALLLRQWEMEGCCKPSCFNADRHEGFPILEESSGRAFANMHTRGSCLSSSQTFTISHRSHAGTYDVISTKGPRPHPGGVVAHETRLRATHGPAAAVSASTCSGTRSTRPRRLLDILNNRTARSAVYFQSMLNCLGPSHTRGV